MISGKLQKTTERKERSDTRLKRIDDIKRKLEKTIHAKETKKCIYTVMIYTDGSRANINNYYRRKN